MAATVSESMNNLSSSLDNVKEDVSKMNDLFVNESKYYALPLSLINSTFTTDKRRLFAKEIVDKYKDGVDELNNLRKDFLTHIKNAVEDIAQAVKVIPDSFAAVGNDLLKAIPAYKTLMDELTVDSTNTKIHENLLSMKKAFLDIKTNLNEENKKVGERINYLEDLHKKNTFDLDKYKKETNAVTENLNNLTNLIMNEINEERKKNGLVAMVLPKQSASSIIADSIINSISRSFQILIEIEIIKQNKMTSIIIIINVEERTSLDLLFIMDITGSMGSYVNQAKQNLIDIINRIVDGCPGIDINMGFVGYRDIEEERTGNVVDIEFTKNHNELKSQINSVRASGGGDFPEDVAWAFEKALNKTWKSNAKFIVFVADAPNHGTKYGGDNRSIPGRRDLSELVKELADNGISLFCMELNSLTKQMYDIFENIYDNYDKSQFQKVKMDSAYSFSNVVVSSAKSTYEAQRKNDGSISFEANKKKLRVYLIEINLILESITNNELYTNNSGLPYVSEYFDQDRDQAIKEMKEELEFATH